MLSCVSSLHRQCTCEKAYSPAIWFYSSFLAPCRDELADILGIGLELINLDSPRVYIVEDDLHSVFINQQKSEILPLLP